MRKRVFYKKIYSLQVSEICGLSLENLIKMHELRRNKLRDSGEVLSKEKRANIAEILYDFS